MGQAGHQPAAPGQLPGHAQVGNEGAGLEFAKHAAAPPLIEAQEQRLGQAAAGQPHRIQEGLVEAGHIGLGRSLTAGDGFLLEPVHHPGDVDVVGAAGGAGLAGGADPDGAAAQHPVCLTQQRQADDLVGVEIHGEGQGAAGGTLLTLIAGRDVGQGRQAFGQRQGWFHWFCEGVWHNNVSILGVIAGMKGTEKRFSGPRRVLGHQAGDKTSCTVKQTILTGAPGQANKS